MFGSAEEQDVPRRRVSRRRTESLREVREPREPRRVSRRSFTEREDRTSEPEENVISDVENRKAPTLLAAEKADETYKRKRLVVVMVILVLGVATSAGVGFTDRGQIDVQQTIEDRNERIRSNQPEERDIIASTVEVPVQDTDPTGKVDGGLVGRGTGGVVPEPTTSELASTTASSTGAVASSTDDGTGESDGEEEAQPSAAPQEETPTETTQ